MCLSDRAIPIGDLVDLIDRGCSWIGVVEEGTVHGGVGAEIIAGLAEQGFRSGFFRVAAENQPIPNGVELESYVLPNASKIVNRIRGLLR